MVSSTSRVHVDHVSIAVPSIDDGLAFFQRHFPVRMHFPKLSGYSGDFNWCDFHIGRFKLELIEPVGEANFVSRFLEKRGPGMHHWSLHTNDLDAIVDPMERDGVRIVDRFDMGTGDKTAFISPRSAFGVLVQFWQVSHEDPHPDVDTVPFTTSEGETVQMRVDHVSIAVRDISAALRFFERYLPFELRREPHAGWDGGFEVASFYLGDYKVELIAPRAGGGGFVEKFLSTRGEGLHHLSIDVDRLDPYLRHLRAAGVRVVDERDFGNGFATAFLSPRSAFGTLIQLWQRPRD